MDLLSPQPFWPIRDGLPATFPPLAKNTSCEVAIVGAGISGALLAALLTEAGLETVVVDRREAAHGSTAGNTGLMLYELDVMLHRLVTSIGPDRAERVYRRCRDTIHALERLVRRARIKCGYERKQSLFLAAKPAHLLRLQREFAARRHASIDVEWWPRSRLVRESTLPHASAILSHDAAQLDAYALTYGLLTWAQSAGARIYDHTAVTRWEFRRHGVDLFTSRDARLRARHLVVAAGYEAAAFLPRRPFALRSTFALITEPIGARDFSGWPADRCVMWDTADPYLYLRTTSDRRAIIGGYDEPFYGPHARDRLVGAKTAALQRRFRQFFPRIPIEVASAWAGTFAVTADGLPLIGRHAEVPHTWFALNVGGNGTVFGLIAAEIIRAELTGRADPDAGLFGFGR